MEAAMENRTKLITALGTRRYDPCRYYIEGDPGRTSSVTRFAAMGLAELAVECGQPLEIVALETAKVKDSNNHKLLHEEFEEKKSVGGCAWELRVEEIPNGKDKEELWQIFETLGKHIEQGDHIIIDITNGFRSLPTVMISAAQYYLYLNKAADLKIYYGAFGSVGNTQGTAGQGQGGGTPEVPIIDITLITSISDWTYGLRLFDEHLITSPLAERIRSSFLGKNASDPNLIPEQFSSALVDSLKKIDFYLQNAMPLEMGMEARKLRSLLETISTRTNRFRPVLRDFLTKLKELLNEVSTDQASKKAAIKLSRDELERQKMIIERQLNSKQVGNALLLAREWLVSAAILYEYKQAPARNKAQGWLRQRTREAYADRLFGNDQKAGQSSQSNQFPEEFIQAWKLVSRYRNPIAHAAMNIDWYQNSHNRIYEDVRDSLDNIIKLL